MSNRDPTPFPCTMTISGTGSYVPERVLTNSELEAMVDTSDDWISSRTGIKERRIAAATETTSDMAAHAARNAIEKAGISAQEIDLLMVATVTPDTFFPSTACWVQAKIGAVNAVCFDISAACAGFLYAIQIGRHFLNTGNRKTVLVIGADKLSSIVNWSDRNTCVLFGDGAGAAILRRRTDEPTDEPRVLSCVMGSDGRHSDILAVPGGGSACPITPDNVALRLNTIRMEGREVYRQAVLAMTSACERALEIAGLTASEVSLVIPHQANLRIIEAISDRLGIPRNRAFINLNKYGNTSAAAIAIALDEASRQGVLKKGDTALLVAFGAGLTWAAAVIHW
ncbi:MAG: beta-ketoacyl-ACP synthase III [Verrucomicrobiales bacterium]